MSHPQQGARNTRGQPAASNGLPAQRAIVPPTRRPAPKARAPAGRGRFASLFPFPEGKSEAGLLARGGALRKLRLPSPKRGARIIKLPVLPKVQLAQADLNPSRIIRPRPHQPRGSDGTAAATERSVVDTVTLCNQRPREPAPLSAGSRLDVARGPVTGPARALAHGCPQVGPAPRACRAAPLSRLRVRVDARMPCSDGCRPGICPG